MFVANRRNSTLIRGSNWDMQKSRSVKEKENCLEKSEERIFIFLTETGGWWVFYALSISLGKYPSFCVWERQNSWDVKRLGEKQSQRLTARVGLCHASQQEKPFLPVLAVQTSAVSLSHCCCNQSTPFSSEHEEILLSLVLPLSSTIPTKVSYLEVQVCFWLHQVCEIRWEYSSCAEHKALWRVLGPNLPILCLSQNLVLNY